MTEPSAAPSAPPRLVPGSRRRPNLTAHMTGLALSFIALGMAASALVAVVHDRGLHAGPLVAAAGVVGAIGVITWRATTVPPQVGTAAVFAAVTGTWLAVSLAGALPYVLAGTFPYVDEAVFESISGFTGTGSTVLAGIQGSGSGILFWRSLTQWFGGMGVIVLAVAVLPFLGVGGLELIRAEAPGPTSDRLAPRVSETAKRLWAVYVALTAIAVGALMAVGLSPFDASTHAFTVVSTGGFSPYDRSIAYFESAVVEAVIIVLMLVAAVNFTLHWRATRGRPSVYAASSELRLLLGLAVGATAVVTALGLADDDTSATAFRDAAFTVASLITSTGFGTADFVQWAPAAQLVLLFLMCTGGMAGSTSGGIKLLRVQVLWRHAMREMRRARHPRAVLPVRHGGGSIGEDVVARVAGFLLAYVVLAVLGTLVVTGLGTDLPTAAGSVVSALSNMGPGLGDAGPTASFLVFSRPARAVLCALMLLGRLEIFSVVLAGVAVTRSVTRRTRRVRRAR